MNNIITSFQIDNNSPLAKIRYRILAFIIDFLLFLLVIMVFMYFFGEPKDDDTGYHVTGFPAMIVMLIGIGLWPISEAVSGQTIGKRVLSIKVVDTKYRPIGIGQAFGRFFLGFIDYMVLMGIIIAIINKKNQRIGDMVSSTIVVSTKKPVYRN